MSAASTPSVLFIGNFLSGMGGRRAICEELRDRLSSLRWSVSSSSSEPKKLLRLAEIVGSCAVRGRRADVAHVDVFSGQAFFLAESACWILRMCGCPYILTLRGGNLPEFAQRWPGRVGALLRSAAAVTAPSGYLVEALSAFRPDIILLPNAIDLSAYPNRLRYGAAPKLIWIRSFHRIYNPSLAPLVVAKLLPRFPDLHLTMVGPDKDGSLKETQATARELGVLSRISFVPGVAKQQVPAYLDAGDVFLNTTNIDNMPVTVVEAMACGLCVVSTNAGGVPYLLKHRENGMITPVDDADAMAAATAEILSDRTLARKLSFNGRAYAEQCDWSRILAEWQKLFTGITRKCDG
jgi:glycosyltransferase involved in cell wall biosynthesis